MSGKEDGGRREWLGGWCFKTQASCLFVSPRTTTTAHHHQRSPASCPTEGFIGLCTPADAPCFRGQPQCVGNRRYKGSLHENNNTCHNEYLRLWLCDGAPCISSEGAIVYRNTPTRRCDPSSSLLPRFVKPSDRVIR